MALNQRKNLHSPLCYPVHRPTSIHNIRLLYEISPSQLIAANLVALAIPIITENGIQQKPTAHESDLSGYLRPASEDTM